VVGAKKAHLTGGKGALQEKEEEHKGVGRSRVKEKGREPESNWGKKLQELIFVRQGRESNAQGVYMETPPIRAEGGGKLKNVTGEVKFQEFYSLEGGGLTSKSKGHEAAKTERGKSRKKNQGGWGPAEKKKKRVSRLSLQ